MSIKHSNSDRTSLNVAFFAGCIIDKVMPEIGISCIKALEHHNVNISVFKNEGCCGMPSLASGDINSFNKLVEYNIDIFFSLFKLTPRRLIEVYLIIHKFSLRNNRRGVYSTFSNLGCGV